MLTLGHVGSAGPRKNNIVQRKDIIKRLVPEDIAVEELINLFKRKRSMAEPALMNA